MLTAALQFFATPFALDRNLATAERLIRNAAGQGARLVALPELFNTGYVYTPRLAASAEDDNGPTLTWMRRLSRELNIYLAGTLLVRVGARVYNALAFASPNGQIQHYYKQHPYAWEALYFSAGRQPVILETDFGRIGFLICWDITYPAAWAAYRGKVDLLLIASSPPRFHRAVLNFPLGKKVYFAELMPYLLRERDAIDRWYAEDLAERAAWLGAPIVHSVMAGRFVTNLPYARLSLLGAILSQPRYWSLLPQAPLASVRATFYGTTAIYDANGATLAKATSEESAALVEVTPECRPAEVALTGLHVPSSTRYAAEMFRVLAR